MRALFWLPILCGVLALGCTQPRPTLSEPSALTLLHSSDLHSRLWPYRTRISRFEAELGLGPERALVELGGLARLATRLRESKRAGPTVWLDSGDALEGAPVFQRFRGAFELSLLSALGLSASALGNHELSLSADELSQRLQEDAAFPLLAANLEVAATSPLHGVLEPWRVVSAAGLRLGVIGVANPRSPPDLGSSPNRWGLEVVPNLAGAVQVAVDEVRPRSALVVVLSHLGLEADRALVAATSGIDLVLGGHQHIVTPEPEWQDDCQAAAVAERGCSPRRVPIVHSGAYAQWVSRLQLGLVSDFARSGELEIATLNHELLPLSAQIPEDPEVVGLLAAAEPEAAAPVADLLQPWARRSALGGDSALGDVVADAVLRHAGADVVLLNSSALREDVEAGPLLAADLELAFPFDEPWRSLWLSGNELRKGLLRAASRAAKSDCQTPLQLAGLRLELRCAACAAADQDCLHVSRGSRALREDELLHVVLPAYLTLAGADFETNAGDEFEVHVPELVAGHLSQLASGTASPGCANALIGWSRARCTSAFGALACPLGPERAGAVCRTLPQVRGGRDGRIEVLP